MEEPPERVNIPADFVSTPVPFTKSPPLTVTAAVEVRVAPVAMVILPEQVITFAPVEIELLIKPYAQDKVPEVAVNAPPLAVKPPLKPLAAAMVRLKVPDANVPETALTAPAAALAVTVTVNPPSITALSPAIGNVLAPAPVLVQVPAAFQLPVALATNVLPWAETI